jgi:hypothetical protein
MQNSQYGSSWSSVAFADFFPRPVSHPPNGIILGCSKCSGPKSNSCPCRPRNVDTSGEKGNICEPQTPQLMKTTHFKHKRLVKYSKIDESKFEEICSLNLQANSNIQKLLNPTASQSSSSSSSNVAKFGNQFLKIGQMIKQGATYTYPSKCIKCKITFDLNSNTVDKKSTINMNFNKNTKQSVLICENCKVQYCGVLKKPINKSGLLINRVEPLLYVPTTTTTQQQKHECLRLPSPGLFSGRDLTCKLKRLVKKSGTEQQDIAKFEFFYGSPKSRMGKGKTNTQRRHLMSIHYRKSLRCVAGECGSLKGNEIIIPTSAHYTLGEPKCGLLQRFPSIEKRNSIFVNVVGHHNYSTILLSGSVMPGLNCDLDGDALLFIPLNDNILGNCSFETQILMSPQYNMGSMSNTLKLEFDSDTKLGLGGKYWPVLYNDMLLYYNCTGDSSETFKKFSHIEQKGKDIVQFKSTWSLTDHMNPNHPKLVSFAASKATRFSNAHLLQVYDKLGKQMFTDISHPIGNNVESKYLTGLSKRDMIVHYQAGWDSLISRSGNDIAMKGQCFYMLLFCLKPMLVAADRLTVVNPTTKRTIGWDVRLLHPLRIKHRVEMSQVAIVGALTVALGRRKDFFLTPQIGSDECKLSKDYVVKLENVVISMESKMSNTLKVGIYNKAIGDAQSNLKAWSNILNSQLINMKCSCHANDDLKKRM